MVMMHLSRIAVLGVIGMMAVGTVGYAQEQGDIGDGQQTRVIEILFAEPGELIDVVRSLNADQVVELAPLGDTNHIIAQGDPYEVEKISALLRSLDSASENEEERDDGTTTKFLSIQSYPIEELVNVIEPFAISRSLQYAIDPVNNHLVLSGWHEEVARLEEMVAVLDRPQESWTVTLAFLRASMSPGDDAGPVGGDLPAYLAPAAEALQAAGFANLQLLAPAIVRVNSGEGFSQKFTRIFRVDSRSETLEFLVHGKARFESGSDRINLEVGARMQGITRTGLDNKSRPEQSRFEVDTTLTAPIGRSIVLSAAPSTTSQGEAIALVVRVTRE